MEGERHFQTISFVRILQPLRTASSILFALHFDAGVHYSRGLVLNKLLKNRLNIVPLIF